MKQQNALAAAFRTADRVLSLEKKYADLPDDGLRAETDRFRSLLASGKKEKDIMPEAFAAAREAAYRAVGLRAYRVQIAGAALIATGHIAEMQTGEGKTLTEVMPAYLTSLSGKGTHVVTVNDYLASRDEQWMGPAYTALGITHAAVTGESTAAERKAGYAADITYVTNNELAFDFLRDNMAVSEDAAVQRPFNFAVIDEADSILIDEARTPFIISAEDSGRTGLFSAADALVRTMKRGKDIEELGKLEYLAGSAGCDDDSSDYRVNEKDSTVVLTKAGTLRTEKFFSCGFLSDPANSEILYCVTTAIRAHALMKNGKDYIVKDGEVLCVDSFTGRVQPGRRFIGGLHQAIEAKENVEVHPETVTSATVTFQTLFNMYNAKAGMTGTALTEAKEFLEIYHLLPVAVPTNVPTGRKDLPDAVYRSCGERDRAVAQRTAAAHAEGRPVLIGTPSVEASERISAVLSEEGIEHSILNAKNNAMEADIISRAGFPGAVTVATNMAGRGTDIKLEGKAKEQGLLVIGTARHESRRIDDQLRGRSGRQGDPGETQFYLAADDELIRMFGGDMIVRIVEAMKVPEGTPLTSKALARNIASAQKTVEGANFETRKHLYEYDKIIAGQTSVIYGMRREALRGGAVSEIPETIADTADALVFEACTGGEDGGTVSAAAFAAAAENYPPLAGVVPEDGEKPDAFAQRVCGILTAAWRKRREEFVSDAEFSEFCGVVFLRTLDRFWGHHINAMTELRKNIGLRSYGGHDPLTEYKKEGGKMFSEMLASFKPEAVRLLLVSEVKRTPPEQPPEQEDGAGIQESGDVPDGDTGTAENAPADIPPAAEDTQPSV